MSEGEVMSRRVIQCKLRLPADLHAEIAAIAKANGRSFNAEIADRIVWSLYRGSILKELLEAARGGTLADFATQAQDATKGQDRFAPPSPLREAAIALSEEVDRMWDDVHRFNPPSWESHAKAISEAQQRLGAIINRAAA